MTTYEINSSFPFEQVKIDEPNGLQGGAYISRIRMDTPILVQTPIISLKQKPTIVNEKRGYVDLMWKAGSPEGTQMTEFINQFETRIKQIIYENREQWFDGDIDQEDIEYFFNTSLKSFQTKYRLLRIQLARVSKSLQNHLTGETQCEEYGVRIYDEDERLLDFPDLQKDTISENPIISILEPYGVKFTSTSFHIEYHLRQIMVLSCNDELMKPVFNQCLIKKKQSTEQLRDSQPLQHSHHSHHSHPATDDSMNQHSHIETEPSNIRDISYTDLNATPTKSKTTEPEFSNTSNSPNVESEQTISLETIDVEPIEQDTISLKHPNQVYYELYQEARNRAKKARNDAIQAFLEAKHIKQTYHLEVESDDESFE